MKKKKIMKNIISGGNKYTRRQDTPKTYKPAGMVYALKKNFLYKIKGILPQGKTVGLYVDPKISVNIDNVIYKVPKFIINEEIPKNYSSKTINQALSFTRNLLLNKFYLPNNLFMPKSRVIFENSFS